MLHFTTKLLEFKNLIKEGKTDFAKYSGYHMFGVVSSLVFKEGVVDKAKGKGYYICDGSGSKFVVEPPEELKLVQV